MGRNQDGSQRSLLLVAMAAVTVLASPALSFAAGAARARPPFAASRAAVVAKAGGGPPPGTRGGAGGAPLGAGGPPPGTPGGPGGPPVGGGGPPGGGGGGGPPGTGAPGGIEKVFETAWPLLYAFDAEGRQDGVRDSSKNLRVLWTRALLSNLGRIEDPVAYELLPSGTRKLVGRLAASTIWSSPIGAPAVEKLDWIVDRTNFIDCQLRAFLDETDAEGASGKRQVVVLGAGYDTRSLRFQSQGLRFFEVDLPDIATAKERMLRRFLGEERGSNSFTGTDVVRPEHVGFDLNEIATQQKRLLDDLVARGLELDPSVPTMVICEAVLFYLMPEAAQGLVKELFALPNARRFCLTDNLAKLGVAPGPPVPTPREKCQEWLGREGKTLIEHDSIWGGAIHFVAAK